MATLSASRAENTRTVGREGQTQRRSGGCPERRGEMKLNAEKRDRVAGHVIRADSLMALTRRIDVSFHARISSFLEPNGEPASICA